MPGKKKGPEKVPKKAEEKKAEKIIQDRTFGLKNKKGAAAQKIIKGIAQKVKGPVKGSEQFQIAEEHRMKEEKKKEAASNALLASLFKTVVTIKETDGQDPKSIICPYFKQGVCTKGDKCKFSHNLNPNQEKPDLYKDPRETKTDITCKFFLEVVIARKHGWFWKCPNGDDCIYRHCLPEGFVIPDPEADVVAEIEEEDIVPLEDQLEEERQKLPSGGTPVTRESFYAWLERKQMRVAAKEEEERKAGLRPTANLKEMFANDPTAFIDDDSAMDEYKVDEENQAVDEGEEQQEPPPVDENAEESQEMGGSGATYYIPDEEESKEESKGEERKEGVEVSPEEQQGTGEDERDEREEEGEEGEEERKDDEEKGEDEEEVEAGEDGEGAGDPN